MFSAILIRLMPIIKLVGEEFETYLPEFKTKIKEIIFKHRKQMATDPHYPTMLLFLASVIIRKYIKKQSQAAMMIFLIEQTIRQAIARLDWDNPDDPTFDGL